MHQFEYYFSWGIFVVIVGVPVVAFVDVGASVVVVVVVATTAASCT